MTKQCFINTCPRIGFNNVVVAGRWMSLYKYSWGIREISLYELMHRSITNILS